jgi:YidC/Oxa1 family membrane protein insertase
MNDIRRTILWVIFGFAMVMLWDKWQIHNGQKPTFFPGPTSTSTTATAPQSPASAAPGAAAGASAVPAPTPVAAAPGVPPAGAPATAAAQRERILVTTDMLRLTFDTEGGSLVRSEFLKHTDLADKNARFVLLDESAGRVYLAQTGLIGGTGYPTHKTVMSFSGDKTLKDGSNELVIKFESPEVGGVKLVKSYLLQRGSYVVTVKHEVVNTGSAPVSPQLYLQLVRDGNKPAGESAFYSTFTGPVAYTEAKKYQKVEFSDIEKNKAEYEKSSANGYVAMVQHYFASAWLLADGIKRELFMRKVDNNLYSVGMITTLDPVAPGSSKVVDARLYVPARRKKRLLKPSHLASNWSRTTAG